MEARLNYDEIQFWDGILELIIPIKKTDAYENIIYPEEYRERLKTLFESVVEPEDYKYERRKELFKKFITRVELNRRLLMEWKELDKEINLEFYKMKRIQERVLSIKKRKQLAEHFRPRVFTSS